MRICTTFIAGLLALSFSAAHSQETDAAKDKAAREKWLATKQKIEAAGFAFDLKKYTPPAVSDAEQNFAAHPMLAENFTAAAKQDRRSTRLGKIELLGLPGFSKRPRMAKDSAGKLFDLVGLAGDSKLDRTAAAQKILKGLSTWSDEFDGLAEAARRPGCSFPLTWERPMIEVNYNVATSVNQHLLWRALGYLQLAQTELATADLTTLLKLTHHSTANPSVLGTLVTCSANSNALRAVREGIMQQRWDEPTLVLVDAELAKLDFGAQLSNALRFELAFSERLSMDWINLKLTPEDFAPLEPTGLDEPIPHKIYAQLDASAGAIFNVVFEKEPSKPIPLPGRLKKMQAFVGKPDNRDAARSAVETKYGIGIRCLRAQAEVSNARTAIAIERFRLKHDNLPNTLDELTPAFLSELPKDPMTGKPPRFGVLPDASIVIYSFGWDGDDDGATPVAELRNRDGDGDWVWRASQPREEN